MHTRFACLFVVSLLGGCACGSNGPVLTPVDGGQDTDAPEMGCVPATEICNGMDDDCDSLIDEGCPCTDGATQACYGGPAGTEGVGVCRGGTQTCAASAWGACVGDVQPSGELCNAADDDCNGSSDDLGTIACGLGACEATVAACSGGVLGVCTPGTPAIEACNGIDDDCDGATDEDGCDCIHVAPTGSDASPGTGLNPLRTIGAAIALAAASGPPIVCVASGSTCPSVASWAEDVVMVDGVSVYGTYRDDGAAPWTRSGSCVTQIRPAGIRGVYFGPTVASPTTIDGFWIYAASTADATTAAITIEGSTGAQVTNDVVWGGDGRTTYGVDIVDGPAGPATPLLARNTIAGGAGVALAVGVHVLRSRPAIREHCDTIDPTSGRCTHACANAIRLIVGHLPSIPGTGESYAIRIEDSPGVTIESSTLCSGVGTDVAGVRLSGDATGTTVRGNEIEGDGGSSTSRGVWMDDCAGAAPWVADNTAIVANPTPPGGPPAARADGVFARSDCHPRIEGNERIEAGLVSHATENVGVYCSIDPTSGVTSACIVAGNAAIRGSSTGTAPTSIGVRCDDGACARIEGNHISARSGTFTRGVALGATATYVARNHIDGGCGRTEAVGLHASGSSARVENNVITGYLCDVVTGGDSYAVLSILRPGAEIDLHSNTLHAGGLLSAVGCRGRALAVTTDPTGLPPGPSGIVRNNVLDAGGCPTRYAVEEQVSLADPRIFQNNNLWSATPPTALYRDENLTNLTNIAAVNALTDMTVTANISADPMLDATDHLMAGSMCIDAGTASGAPGTDFDGDPRPSGAGYDVGADER